MIERSLKILEKMSELKKHYCIIKENEGPHVKEVISVNAGVDLSMAAQ